MKNTIGSSVTHPEQDTTKITRRASTVLNLIAIRFDCSMAKTRVWFKRPAIAAPNSGATISQRRWNENNDVDFKTAEKTRSLSQDSRRRRKESLQKVLHLLQARPSAVIASLFPYYTPVFGKISRRKLHCCLILPTTTTTQLRMVQLNIARIQR